MGIGVDFIKRSGCWSASLRINEKKLFFGFSHSTERQAARVVNDECRKRGIPIKNPEVETDNTMDEEVSKWGLFSEDEFSESENEVPQPNINNSERDFFLNEIQSLRQQVEFYEQR